MPIVTFILGTGLGFIWMCFYECAAYLSVDTLQKDYQPGNDWKKIVLNINMISIFIGLYFFRKKSFAGDHQ